VRSYQCGLCGYYHLTSQEQSHYDGMAHSA
jgi:rubredoxin